MSVLSPEEIKKVSREFILDAPPGELLEVVTDIRGLVANDGLVGSFEADALREYNTAQLIVAKLPGSDDKVLISRAGEIDASHYVDSVRGNTVAFDHVKGVVTAVEGAHSFPSGPEATRAAALAEVKAYVQDHFSDAGFGVYSSASGAKGALTVCYSGTRSSVKNFWSGRWRATWTVDLASREVRGRLGVIVHYFEDGNVQLDCVREVADSVDATDPAGLAKGVVAVIKKSETTFHKDLNATYSSLSDQAFKELRRKLPVNASKFDWDKAVSQHSLASELSKK